MTNLPRYQRILLATDGSDYAQQVTEHALALAKQTGAALDAVYVVDDHLAFIAGIYRDEALRDMRQEGERALEAVAERAKGIGVPFALHLAEGRPAESILREADRLQSDLVVLGSNGQGDVADFLLGSASSYVVHRAHIPVCIVRPPA